MKDEVCKIIDILLNNLSNSSKEKQISLSLTKKTKDFIIEKAYGSVYGARSLKRFIQSKAETLIGGLIIKERGTSDKSVVIDADEGKLEVDF